MSGVATVEAAPVPTTTIPADAPASILPTDASGAKTTPSGGFTSAEPARENPEVKEIIPEAIKAQARLIYRARLAEQVERYDEMAAIMKQAALSELPLRVEERNLLSVAYKNSVGERRAAWRIVSSIEVKQNDPEFAVLAGEYRGEIEKELNSICNEILDLLENRLLKDLTTSAGISRASLSMSEAAIAEARVFYYKMQGDYFRYIAEFISAEERSAPKARAEAAYRAGLSAAEELLPVNPIRLGLILNFSVFYYEIMNDPEEACRLAQGAFDEAVAGLDTASEPTYRDAALIIQLLRDNLTLWSHEASRGVDPAESSAPMPRTSAAKTEQKKGATSHRDQAAPTASGAPPSGGASPVADAAAS